MKKIEIDVLKYRKLSAAVSVAFIVLGIVLYFVFGGFNLGIDFGSGYSEQVKFAPLGLSASYHGSKSMTLSVPSGTLVLSIRDSNGVEEYSFPAEKYPTSGDLAKGLEEHGITVNVKNGGEKTGNLVSGFGFPATLSSTPTRLNFSSDAISVTTSDVRAALSEVDGLKVQTVGGASSSAFQIRMNLKDGETQEEAQNRINRALFAAFGEENTVMMQSDYVGPKFSASLLSSSIKAVLIAIVLILVYITFRFRPAYALSSVLALFHDVMMMLSFVVVFQLEVSSTTIAAILTIIGYSLNNTIVIFDRVRENIREQRGAEVAGIVSWSVRQSFTRTLITTVTTLLAIVPLAIFSTGDIKLFAINLIWGLVIGAYSSNFIAPSLLMLFHGLAPINVFKEKKDEEYSLVD